MPPTHTGINSIRANSGSKTMEMTKAEKANAACLKWRRAHPGDYLKHLHKYRGKLSFEVQKRRVALRERIVMDQGEGCAICGTTKSPLVPDHNHATDDIRGLLCSWCNTGVGLFTDNVKSLESAIRYLKKSTTYGKWSLISRQRLK